MAQINALGGARGTDPNNPRPLGDGRRHVGARPLHCSRPFLDRTFHFDRYHRSRVNTDAGWSKQMLGQAFRLPSVTAIDHLFGVELPPSLRLQGCCHVRRPR